MLKRIKHTFITLGIASGMTAVAMHYLHNLDTCRSMVLRESVAHEAFLAEIETKDFLTAMTRGR
jgi:hypothetical protein